MAENPPARAAQSAIGALARHLGTDVLAYRGPIGGYTLRRYRDVLEHLADRQGNANRLSIVLTTNGGQVEVVEKLADMTRHFYDLVDFYVPNYAMSAGTIWCMSGQRIFMDYFSSMGPVDPQILDGGASLPTLGYVYKYEQLLEKSAKEGLCDAELSMLLRFDLGAISLFEQASDLSRELIGRWLRTYRSGAWNVMPDDAKAKKADHVAALLSDHSLWHSHSRMIGRDTLRAQLGLDTEDLGTDRKLRDLCATSMTV